MAGMSDTEVQGQIKHMIAFIEQEASEKVEEIDAKAEEEFNLEKGRLVQSARAKVMDYYDKKIKQVELQKKIQQSNLLNTSRLQILKRKEELLNDLLDEARRSAHKTVNEDPARYRETMITLTLQGLAQLLEPKITVQVRQQDAELMKQIVPEVQQKYKKVTHDKYEVKLTVDDLNFLPSELIGGVVLSAHGDKIRINNTLNERLKLISRQMQPEVRETLFGPNPNRKFKD